MTKKNVIEKPRTGYKSQEAVHEFAEAIFGEKKAEVDIDSDPYAEGLKLPMKSGLIVTVTDEAVMANAWDAAPLRVETDKDWSQLSPAERNKAFSDHWFLDHLRAQILKNKWRETLTAGGSFSWVIDPSIAECCMWPEDDEKYILKSDRCGIGRVLAEMSPYVKKHADGKRCKANSDIPTEAVSNICEVVCNIAETYYITDSIFSGRELPTWEKAQPFMALTCRPKGLAAAAKLGLINGSDIMSLISEEEADKEWKEQPALELQSPPEVMKVRRWVNNSGLLEFLNDYQRDMHRIVFRCAVKPGKVYRTKVGKVLADGGWLWAPQYVFTLPGEPDAAGRFPCVMVECREAASFKDKIDPYNMTQKRVFTDVSYKFEMVACFDMVGYIDRTQLSGPVRDLIRVPMSDDMIMDVVKRNEGFDLPKGGAPAGYWKAAAVSERLLYARADSAGDMKSLGQCHKELYTVPEKPETPKEP